MDYKKVELLQNIWGVTTNIIGYSLIAALASAGLRLREARKQGTAQGVGLTIFNN